MFYICQLACVFVYNEWRLSKLSGGIYDLQNKLPEVTRAPGGMKFSALSSKLSCLLKAKLCEASVPEQIYPPSCSRKPTHIKKRRSISEYC